MRIFHLTYSSIFDKGKSAQITLGFFYPFLVKNISRTKKQLATNYVRLGNNVNFIRESKWPNIFAWNRRVKYIFGVNINTFNNGTPLRG